MPVEDPLITAGPNDVVRHRIGNRETGLATAHRAERPNRDRPPAQRIRRPTTRSSILAVSVQVVRHLRISEDVVHLRDREQRPIPVPSAIRGDLHALVVADDHPVGQQRIDPHVVIVPTPERREREAAVERFAMGGGHEMHFVCIVRGYRHPRVVERALGERVVCIDHAPGATAVVGAPQRALMLVERLEFRIGARLDERVHPVRVIGRYTEPDPTHHAVRKAVPFEAGPVVPAVAAHPQSALRPAALTTPGPDLHLPSGRIKDPRIGWIHHDVDRPRIDTRGEHLLPRLAAVLRAVEAALLLRPVQVTGRRHEDDVGIRRMDRDASDPAAQRQAHVPPVLAAVGRAIHAVADRYVAPDERLAGPGPNHVGVGGRDRERADRLRLLIVEDRPPSVATVFTLEHASGRRTEVVDIRVARLPDHRAHAVADRPHVSEVGAGEEVVREVGKGLRSGRGGYGRQPEQGGAHREQGCGQRCKARSASD